MLAAATNPAMIGIVAAIHGDRYILRRLATFDLSPAQTASRAVLHARISSPSVAEPPSQLRFWQIGRALGDGVHDVWCRKDQSSPWAFQVMLDEAMVWTGFLADVFSLESPLLSTSKSTTEIPFSIPELQLFYKARDPRPKDELDFAAALPLLNASQIAWLRSRTALMNLAPYDGRLKLLRFNDASNCIGCGLGPIAHPKIDLEVTSMDGWLGKAVLSASPHFRTTHRFVSVESIGTPLFGPF